MNALPFSVVDLSWPVRPGMPAFPGDPPMRLKSVGELCLQGFRAHVAELPTHCGTHMDAPAHVLAEGPLLSELPVERFAGPGVVLDLRGRPNAAIDEADLAPHMEDIAAAAPAFVLLRTGDEGRFGEAAYFAQGAHLTPGAAEMLAGLAAGGLSGVGLDAASPDAPGDVDLPAHRALLGAGVLIVENLRNLAALPPRGLTFLCAPVLGVDGSPVRALALVPPTGPANPGAT